MCGNKPERRWLTDATFHSEYSPNPENKYNTYYKMLNDEQYRGRRLVIGDATKPQWNDYAVYEVLGYAWYGKLDLTDGTYVVRPDNSYEYDGSDKRYVLTFRLYDSHSEASARKRMEQHRVTVACLIVLGALLSL